MKTAVNTFAFPLLNIHTGLEAVEVEETILILSSSIVIPCKMQ